MWSQANQYYISGKCVVCSDDMVVVPWFYLEAIIGQRDVSDDVFRFLGEIQPDL